MKKRRTYFIGMVVLCAVNAALWLANALRGEDKTLALITALIWSIVTIIWALRAHKEKLIEEDKS